LHLPPQKSSCPGACKFNSAYKKFIGTNGQLCRECKGSGFLLEPRQTLYRANIRWTDEPLDKSNRTGQNTTAGRVFTSLVRTKTVIESYDDILKSIGATVDGEPVKLFNNPRKTGFGNKLMYVVTFWEITNK
jgi:hypothetical protein